jgi:small subunit ribosomal protein S17
MSTTTETTTIRKTLRGTVVSTAMDKTVVVMVGRFVKHPKYRKYYKVTKKYKAHDEANEYRAGDVVAITACRPLSKTKSFIVTECFEKASQDAE